MEARPSGESMVKGTMVKRTSSDSPLDAHHAEAAPRVLRLTLVPSGPRVGRTMVMSNKPIAPV
jgi:hypothetical protein